MKKLIPHVLAVVSAISLLANTASAQDNIMPIAISARSLDGVEPGAVLGEVFGWVTWTGNQANRTLAASLAAPGDSASYVNPSDPSDNEVNAGDWVRAKLGDFNARAIREAMDDLVGTQIVVPVCDSVRIRGGLAYRVSDFAVVEILSYNLVRNRITFRFVDYFDDGALPPPV
jgi:hypothetical protein